jgi:hypothetical protein
MQEETRYPYVKWVGRRYVRKKIRRSERRVEDAGARL